MFIYTRFWDFSNTSFSLFGFIGFSLVP